MFWEQGFKTVLLEGLGTSCCRHCLRHVICRMSYVRPLEIKQVTVLYRINHAALEGRFPYERIGFGEGRFPYEKIGIEAIMAIIPMGS